MTAYISAKDFHVDDYNPLELNIKYLEDSRTNIDVLIAGITLLVISIIVLTVIIIFASALSVAAICCIAIAIIILSALGLFFIVGSTCGLKVREPKKQHAKELWYLERNSELATKFYNKCDTFLVHCAEIQERTNDKLAEELEALKKAKKFREKQFPFLVNTSGVIQEIGSEVSNNREKEEVGPKNFGSYEMEELANNICNLYEMYNLEYKRIKKLYPKEHKAIAQGRKESRNSIKEFYNQYLKGIEENEEYLSSLEV